MESEKNTATKVKGERMRELVRELEWRKAEAREMGGSDKVSKQHAQNKLTCRERIDKLFDQGTFVETGILATHMGASTMRGKEAPADGVVTGFGKIGGRYVGVAAYDFTVMAGSIGHNGEVKVTRIRELCLKERMPIVWLVDSAGARIQEAAGTQFAGSGYLFREQVVMSGVVPQVAAMVGPGAAGTAYIPGLADFVPMVKGIGSMALAGPPLVKAAVGEDVTEQELGGSAIHCKESGVGHLEVESDDACLQAIRDYLSYFPSHNGEKPPILPCDDPIDRRDESLLEVVPDDVRYGFDMHEVIKRVTDHGKFFEIQPDFGKALVTGFARFGGRSCGIVASNSKQAGGALDNDCADKAAHFITCCDAFNIPLLFLQDVPGFWVGSRVEKQGIIRHGAKMLYAVSSATVPKITVVVRKAYGAGYYVMCGAAYEPDLLVAWPTAEISLMGAEGAVNIIFRKQIESSENPAEARKQLVAQFKQYIDPYIAAGHALIDDIIDPRDTRAVICKGLEMAWNKQIDRPARKTGVWPV
ncbi:MAG TPA: acyl-CoA carboxylase subunit beta [Planctomycetota bacterium]|nr:acyl-CoA carboxylase subunit beta [Planctomycetota bacterium]